MRINRHLRILFIFIVAIVLPLVSLDGCTMKGPTTIKVLSDEWAGYAPVEVAKMAGYFDKYNLDVDISYRYKIEDVESQKPSNFDVVMDSIAPFIVANDSKFELVAPVDISVGGDGIVVRDENFIDPETWIGKTIIAYGQSTPESLIYQVLKERGYQLNQVNIKSVIPQTGVPFNYFNDEDVVAIATWEPFLSRILRENNPAIVSHSTESYYGLIIDIATFDVDVPIKSRTNFVKAIYDASWLLQNSPDQYYQYLTNSSNYDVDEVMKATEYIEMLSYTDYESIMGDSTDGRKGILEQYYALILDYAQSAASGLNIRSKSGRDFIPYSQRVKPIPVQLLYSESFEPVVAKTFDTKMQKTLE